MKKRIIALTAMLLVVLAAFQANAEIVKFQQLPLDGIDVGGDLRMYFGHDEVSTAYTTYEYEAEPIPIGYKGCFMADDFADLVDDPVIRIKWWGSYIENYNDPEVHRFLIAWETDVPYDPDNNVYYSHPGQVIQSEIVTVTSGKLQPGFFTETLYSSGGYPCYENLYEYEAILNVPFPQQPNTVYWLKIVALIDVDPAKMQLLEACLGAAGITLCDYMNMPIEQQMQLCDIGNPITRWGWHNRDYTINDPYASVNLPTYPGGEVNRGPIFDPTGMQLDVWHFQDDAVSGNIYIDTLQKEPVITQDGYKEQYYVYDWQFCTDWAGTPLGDVDGPNDIKYFSKDLAFILYADEEIIEELDYGDAPDSYQTLLASDGARHAANPEYSVWLGDFTDAPDAEPDGQPSAPADGDDMDGNDDEDGVNIPLLMIGQSAIINFEVNSSDGLGGQVEAWIDYDGNGVFDAYEQIIANYFPDGVHSQVIAIPPTALGGQTYARFRIARTVPITAVGLVSEGEVEDYIVEIQDDPDSFVKFQQLPLDGPNYYGHDEFSTAYSWYDDEGMEAGYRGCYMADDFADYESTPVIAVKWWGSYIMYEDVMPAQRFLIAFESDVPAVGEPGDNDYVPSHPGEILSTEIVTINTDNSLDEGEFTETWVGPGFGVASCYEPLFEYKALLNNPFPEDPNTVYWIKIVAMVDVDPFYVQQYKDIMLQNGIELCDIFEDPSAYDIPYITMWGWHNRDYKIMDPYACVAPSVTPGEHVQGFVIMPNQTDTEVWHFQDDSVYGDVFIEELEDGQDIYVFQDPTTWEEQYYKWFLPYCTYSSTGYANNVDGPEEIEMYSKDLAFELFTEECGCLGDFNNDGYVDGGDIPQFIAAFGSAQGQPGYNCRGDFNGDGYVDGGDVPGLIAAFGSVCP